MNYEHANRTLHISLITCGDKSFFMESVLDPWGEDDPILAQVMDCKFDEAASLAIWSDIASRAEHGDLLIDVGAFSGIYALTACAVSSKVRAIAFEPSAITFSRLARNVIINNVETRILAANLAAGRAPAQQKFPHQFGVYSLNPGESSQSTAFDHTQTAQVVPLDAILNEGNTDYLNSKAFNLKKTRHILAIKIDVEGAELAVLDGARQLIAKHQPIIIAEFLNDEAYDNLVAFGILIGYSVRKISSERNALMQPEQSLFQVIANSIPADDRLVAVRGRRVHSITFPQF